MATTQDDHLTPPKSSTHRCRAAAYQFLDTINAGRVKLAGSIILSGFWRSGTTWLHEALAEAIGAKTIYEPFDPRAYRHRIDQLFPGLPNKRWEYLQAYMPFIGGSLSTEHPLLRSYLDRLLRGQISGSWMRTLRQGIAESFRPRTVVKFTRGALALKAIHDAFGVGIVHVYRDPRAIVASLKRKGWRWYHAFSLTEQLIDTRDGREAFFAPWYETIREIDQTDPPQRIAAYWSLTESYLAKSLVGPSNRFLMFPYEQMVQEGAQLLPDVLQRLGLAQDLPQNMTFLSRNSATTDESRKQRAPQQRLHSWQEELMPKEIDGITAVVERIGLGERLSSRPA